MKTTSKAPWSHESRACARELVFGTARDTDSPSTHVFQFVVWEITATDCAIHGDLIFDETRSRCFAGPQMPPGCIRLHDHK